MSQLFIHRQCLHFSHIFEKHKKSKNKIHHQEGVADSLKKELPFLFKAIKSAKSHEKKSLSHKEERPLIFQPVTVDAADLEDNHSDIYKELKIHAAKSERVFIIQPNFKWGKERFLTKLTDNRLAEAKALIESVQSWGVHSSSIESVHEHNPKMFFGSGKVLELSEQIRELINEHGVTMVFLNTGKLTLRQIKELESAWGCKVFDRYRVVLELFKERAKTKEAKLQVQLAEVQYLRTHITSDDLHYDQQRGGGKGRFGSGETEMEKIKRQLFDAEAKIKKSLLHIKGQRSQAKAERIKKKVPQVALVGYTNAGKTTLAKLLSHDAHMQPEDKLFATLDTTAHRGKLPCGLNLVYIDTVGFISDLPHELVESFSTTLDDVRTADVLLHVSDYAHPEFDLQKKTVEDVLDKLKLNPDLLRNMVHVLNKIDLREPVVDGLAEEKALSISATEGTGVEGLRHLIERKILEATNRRRVQVNIDQQGGELSWLYHYGTVLDTIAHDDGSLDVIAILDDGNRNKFEKKFHVKLKH